MILRVWLQSSSCSKVTPLIGLSLRLVIQCVCGKSWRQSLLGFSSWGQIAVGEAVHYSKVSLIVYIPPSLHSFCCWSDPLLSWLRLLAQQNSSQAALMMLLS